MALSVEFASDSAELRPQARRQLDVLGEALQSSELKECCFRIEGHTDDQNTNAYNQRLSERRAASVVRYLAERFRIDPERLLALGFGEEQPLVGNETPEGRQKNRRVQISNLGFQSYAGGS